MSEVSRGSLDVSLIDADTIREHFSYLYLFGNGCIGKYQIRNDVSNVIYIYKNNGEMMTLGGKNLLYSIKKQKQCLNVMDYDWPKIAISTEGQMYSIVTRSDPIMCGDLIMKIYNDFMGDLLLQISCCMLLTHRDFIRYTYG